MKGMVKTISEQAERRTYKAALVAKTAEIVKVSERQVRRVLAGESKNETVLETYMTLLEEFNKLPNAVRELVPFN